MKRLELKIVLKNLSRNKLHSLINIVGFAIGIAVFVLIVLYANHKLSYDQFHSQHENIYKLWIGDYDEIPPPIVNKIAENFPEIESSVRLDHWYGGGLNGYLKTDNKTIKVEKLLFADSAFFSFFDFNLMKSESANEFNEPNTIILSKSLSYKIFGSSNPVGQYIEYKSKVQGIKYDFKIVGVVDDVPSNSSIQYSGLVSMATIEKNGIRNGNLNEDWGNWGFSSFIKIKDNQSIESLKGKINPFWENLIKERWNIQQGTDRAEEYKLSLVPLEETYFHATNKKSFIYLIVVIGIIILALAMVNYINLSLAISTTRIKEIGVRKAIGSKWGNLFKQFINESVILTLMASVVAILLIYASKSFYYDVTGCNELIQPEKLWSGLLIFIAGAVTIGFISGAYPAFHLTKIQTVHALKNELNKGKSSSILKNVLVVFQFVISISLIIAVIAITEQVDYMKTSKLGFNHQHILYFAQSQGVNEKYDVFKQTLMEDPNVISVSRSNGSLGHQFNISSKHKVNGVDKTYRATTVDPDFVNTMGIELIMGRNFSWDRKNDFYKTALVNENFVKEFELETPIGAKVKFLGSDAEIIGVVKNFHNSSLHHSIQPSLFFYNDWGATVNIKINENDIEGTIASIKQTWDKFSEDMPFEYQFLDETYNRLYKSETEFGLLIKIFSVLAVCIACLGLFGLVSFTATKRKKEIGVRKINGAKIHEILSMLNQDITKWVIVAFIIACPIAWYAMNSWLDNFAYKTELSWWMFALAGFLTLLIALGTVSWQSWRAASRNPVEALRYE